MEDDTTTTTTVDETTTTTTEAPAEETTTTTTEPTEPTTEETTTEETTTEETTTEQITEDLAGTENAVPADLPVEETQPERDFDETDHAAAQDTAVAEPANDPVLGHDRPSDPLENTQDAVAKAQAEAAQNAVGETKTA